MLMFMHGKLYILRLTLLIYMYLTEKGKIVHEIF